MKLVLIGGSLRPGSLNRRLMGHLAHRCENLGHSARCFQGEDLNLPLYWDELPVPVAVATLQNALQSAQGVILVSPEYNAGIPAHLKNAVDWVSVQQPSPWPGLPVLLAAASPGALGGARGLIPWRATLANLGCWVAPGVIAIPRAHETLSEQGAPLDERSQSELDKQLGSFLEVAQRLRP